VSDREDKLRSLMVLGNAGDRAAYHAFLQALGAHLRAFFRRRLVQLPDEVEDLVQETLLAVHNYRHTYDADQPLTAWIHAIARYKLADLMRRRNGHEALNDPLDAEADILLSSDQEATDAKRDVATLLAQLPERQRLPIQYVKLDGLSVVEAARLTGMPVSAIKIGVHRGLKVLAEKMKGRK
jgi:RNA polymerase sigma-70 factor (ECF subfamily)